MDPIRICAGVTIKGTPCRNLGMHDGWCHHHFPGGWNPLLAAVLRFAPDDEDDPSSDEDDLVDTSSDEDVQPGEEPRPKDQ